ncbi:hypothetical protein BJ875DRAFT_383383 [Amylocarpus encephaloides]|uniref:Protein YAE1 n=1 Tax=Amylocarpus encephaloides TaxID=45428 RepID=A0A9P7YDC1_9HELO|nr:hypothetical protein BJ875DRAFT_383383 [Amylocarpus encephaloides]
MLRDDAIFPAATGIPGEDIDGADSRDAIITDPPLTNDTFDDVFGSAPPSPNLDPENSGTAIWHPSGGNIEPSDVPRLKEKHETEGYRDGVTKGKGETVQAGFDEGYGLGAVLGLRIGKMLGLLEGLDGAVSHGAKIERGEEWGKEARRMHMLLADGRRELATESLFGTEYWGVDGIWTYPVPGEHQEGFDLVFTDVADAHPLMVKWNRIVDDEMQKWDMDLSLMDHEPAAEPLEEPTSKKRTEVPQVDNDGGPKNELSW